ncbi:MAG: hypothetical protein JXB88_05830 [Spirochaetales bacterium]|nr:hypothetical protein [Spirochaetales bacterium]
MGLPELHEFHFVIGHSMRIRMEKLDVWGNVHNISGIIVKILLLLVPVIKREHDWGKQRKSRYEYVSPDPNEKREHAHAYLPENLYRKLKLIHHDLNFFSMGQIVRFFIRVFFKLVDEYKEDVLKELERMYKEWEKEVKDGRLTLRQYMRQLRIVVQHLRPRKRIITVYDHRFMPFWRLRL